ncbi:hypothetical protein S83_071356, partial [Arachis hypogaea]
SKGCIESYDSDDRAAMDFLDQAIYKAREEDKQTTSSLLDVIERYAYGDAYLNSKLPSEMRIFKNVEQDFGRQSEIPDRSTVMP